MPDFTWMQAEEDISPAALTVRAQTVDPTDEGRLLWDQFMPRRDVDTTKIGSLTTQQFRPTADRREWNQRGRYINLVTPPTREIEWVPIESYFRLEEKEINDLLNEVRGNQELFRRVIQVRIPERTDILALANWRRVEVDVFKAWTEGKIIQKNPQDGRTYEVSYGFDAARYTTAAPDWTTNAFDKLIVWLQSAYETIGPMAGIMLRLATRNAIVKAAPNPLPGVQSGVRPSVAAVEALIQDQIGRPFRFFVNENTVEVYSDGGITRSKTKVWPQHKIAAIPSDFRIGSTAFAPVLRAYDISSQTPEAGIDVRGVTVYHDVAGAGRDLTVEAQINPMPDPDEGMIYVTNVGV